MDTNHNTRTETHISTPPSSQSSPPLQLRMPAILNPFAVGMDAKTIVLRNAFTGGDIQSKEVRQHSLPVYLADIFPSYDLSFHEIIHGNVPVGPAAAFVLEPD